MRPVTTPLAPPTARQTVYVPIYSSIYLGLDINQRMVELAATLSVRNVSPQYPLVLNFVRYYDSAGKPLREYLREDAELPPLASVEFVIQRADTSGGPGANFLIRWTGSTSIDQPLIEAVMVGQSASAGFSFTTSGRVITNEIPR